MNEEALNEAYAVLKSEGYADSIEDFKVLIATNTEALNEAYSVFKSGGYADSIEDFKTLLGVTAPSKKKYLQSLLECFGTLWHLLQNLFRQKILYRSYNSMRLNIQSLT